MSLKEKLGIEPLRGEIIGECVDLVDKQVKAKRGFSGAAIKTAYATVKAVKKGFVPSVVNALLDDWLVNIQPFHDEWKQEQGFADYLVSRQDEVAEALLEVTDRRIGESEHRSVQKLYKKLRGSARSNVEEAIPGLGTIIGNRL